MPGLSGGARRPVTAFPWILAEVPESLAGWWHLCRDRRDKLTVCGEPARQGHTWSQRAPAARMTCRTCRAATGDARGRDPCRAAWHDGLFHALVPVVTVRQLEQTVAFKEAWQCAQDRPLWSMDTGFDYDVRPGTVNCLECLATREAP